MNRKTKERLEDLQNQVTEQEVRLDLLQCSVGKHLMIFEGTYSMQNHLRFKCSICGEVQTVQMTPELQGKFDLLAVELLGTL